MASATESDSQAEFGSPSHFLIDYSDSPNCRRETEIQEKTTSSPLLVFWNSRHSMIDGNVDSIQTYGDMATVLTLSSNLQQ